MLNLDDLFKEFEKHLLNDERPSNYFNKLSETGLFSQIFPFTMLGDLKKVEQSPKHHPEGSVWNHTMMVVDIAASKKVQSNDQRVFMWTSLLHDLGKAPTTKIRKGRITSYNHDVEGEKMASTFLKQFTNDEKFIKKVAVMVRWHMQILFVVKDLAFASINKMVSQVSIDEIALFGLCDRLGRGKMSTEKEVEEENNISIFKQKCRAHVHTY